MTFHMVKKLMIPNLREEVGYQDFWDVILLTLDFGIEEQPLTVILTHC